MIDALPIEIDPMRVARAVAGNVRIHSWAGLVRAEERLNGGDWFDQQRAKCIRNELRRRVQQAPRVIASPLAFELVSQQAALPEARSWRDVAAAAGSIAALTCAALAVVALAFIAPAKAAGHVRAERAAHSQVW